MVDLASVGTERPPEMRPPTGTQGPEVRSEMRSEMRSPPSRKGTEYSDDLEGDGRGADATSDDEGTEIAAEIAEIAEMQPPATSASGDEVSSRELSDGGRELESCRCLGRWTRSRSPWPKLRVAAQPRHRPRKRVRAKVA